MRASNQDLSNIHYQKNVSQEKRYRSIPPPKSKSRLLILQRMRQMKNRGTFEAGDVPKMFLKKPLPNQTPRNICQYKLDLSHFNQNQEEEKGDQKPI